ncbi:MAG TPA: CoA-transferase [Acidimicrobiales bacterium]
MGEKVSLQEQPLFASVEDLVANIEDGDRIGVGGALLTRLPLVALHALAARAPKNLEYVSWGGGVPLEILLGAGAVSKIVFCFSSLDIFGLAPLFRKSLEEGSVEYEEWPAFAFSAALEASKQNLPSMPFRIPKGSDLFGERRAVLSSPDSTEEIQIGLAPRRDLDVFVMHAQRVDEAGNVEICGARGMDTLAVFCARTVLVTAEEVVPVGSLGNLRDSFVIPRDVIHQIAIEPFGAYPSSCLPHYIADFACLADVTSSSPPPQPPRPNGDVAQRLRAAPSLNHETIRATVVDIVAGRGPSLEPPTIDEIMVCWLASRYDNDSICSAGAVSPLAVTSYLLAKATHAPRMSIMMTSGGLVDIALRPMLLGLGEALDTASAPVQCGGEDTYRWYYQQGRVTCEVVASAQIDRHARTNNIEVTSPKGRRVRLPGQGGMADVADLHRDFVLYQTRQSTMSLVESVNRVSASRHLITPEQRRRAGLVAGEVVLITNLGIYQLDQTSGELVLTHVHPGVTLDEVRAATGFTLTVSDKLMTTPVPSPEVLRVLRDEIDPLAIRRLEFVPAQERSALLAQCIAAEQDLIDRSLAHT